MQHVIYVTIACDSYGNYGIDYALQHGGVQIHRKSIQYPIYSPFVIWPHWGHRPPFLPPIQLRYMPNDVMTVRKPKPSIYICANSVVKEKLSKLAKCEGFNRGTTSQKCTISWTPTKSTKYFNICIPRPPRYPVVLPSTFPRPSLYVSLNLPLIIPPEPLPTLCNEKGLILEYRGKLSYYRCYNRLEYHILLPEIPKSKVELTRWSSRSVILGGSCRVSIPWTASRGLEKSPGWSIACWGLFLFTAARALRNLIP